MAGRPTTRVWAHTSSAESRAAVLLGRLQNRAWGHPDIWDLGAQGLQPREKFELQAEGTGHPDVGHDRH